MMTLKKMMAWMMSLMLLLGALPAFAESGGGTDSLFEKLSALDWSFSSGVGGWSTELKIAPDGTFTGAFHDSEMGETGETYPSGTVYGCTFSGKLSVADQAGDGPWKVRVDALRPDEGQVPEAIEDGVRYVTADPYGLSEGDEMTLYQPGTPVSVLSESMQHWAHVLDQVTPPLALESWFLMSEKNDSGFVGMEAAPAVGLANPWTDLTAEELREKTGIVFGVPKGAENVIYRYLAAENLAEMQFTLGQDEFSARIQPAALKEDELINISGMYFAWENEEKVTVAGFPGMHGEAKTGSSEWVQLCLWADAAGGRMYALSVYTVDPDGLDLPAIAEQIVP